MSGDYIMPNHLTPEEAQAQTIRVQTEEIKIFTVLLDQQIKKTDQLTAKLNQQSKQIEQLADRIDKLTGVETR
jgi:ABC-type transporter Mla subunit MlaD